MNDSNLGPSSWWGLQGHSEECSQLWSSCQVLLQELSLGFPGREGSGC